MTSEAIFVQTVVIGALIVVPIARMRDGTWLNAAGLFAFGWLSVIFCYMWADFFSPEGFDVPDTSFEFGALIVMGGYLGVLLAHVCFGPPKGVYLSMRQNFQDLGLFLDKYYLLVCGFVFIVGSVAMIEQFSKVGFSIFTLQDLRSLHVHTRFSVLQRFGVLGTLALSMIVGLSATDDALRGRVNSKRVLAIIVALFPLALSKGSRQEFLNPIIIYFVHVFIVMRVRSIEARRMNWRMVFGILIKFVPLFAALLLMFTVYGQLRTVASKETGGRFELFSLAEAPVQVSVQVTAWLASSLYSLGPIASFEDATFPRMHGRILLEPIFKVPEKLRLIPETGVLIYLAKQAAFEHFKHGIIAFTPGTMGKVLTREVGMRWAPFLGGVVMFLLTAIATRLRPDSILKLGIVFLCSWQILMTFQTLQGLNMAIAWRILFVFLIGLAYRRFRQKGRIIS